MAIENFTTYTEADPNSKLTITSTKIDIGAIDRGDISYVHDDKGSAHFDGDYEHLIEMYVDSATSAGYNVLLWALSNDSDKQSVDSKTALACRVYNEAGSAQFFSMEQDGASGYQDGSGNLSLDTLYYITIERDESVGTYGTQYVYVYSDSGRTSLQATCTLVLHTSKKDFQYVYGFANRGEGSGNPWTGYSQNLDLQEVSASPTNLKTENTVATASIKTKNTVAKASYKTVNTVT